MQKKAPKVKKSQVPARRMECDRRERGSSESMAAKEAAKTKANWKEASKAVIEEETAEATIKEETAEAVIKEENVKAASQNVKRKN